MIQYIDKATVIAEIEKMLKEEYPCDNSEQTTGYHRALYELQDFLNTLEIKEDELSIYNIDDILEERYYMALEELKAQKGE